MKAPLQLLAACLCCVIFMYRSAAQPGSCILKEPTVHIDFGRGNQVSDFNTAALYNYGRITGSCPTDGHYTFTPATYDCFRGDWFTITQDHTPGDVGGNMMLVNASPDGGIFLQRTIRGLQGGRRYELALWMINVCRLYICCSSLSPNVSFSISIPGGKKVAAFRIGDLPQRTSPQWRKFAGYFTMPAGQSTVVLTMYNNTVGGCGNDFALDDITFRECMPPQPVLARQPKPVQPRVAKQQPAGPVVKTVTLKSPPSRNTAKVVPQPRRSLPVPAALPPAKEPRMEPVAVPVPIVLRTRDNPLVRRIETGAGEIIVDLYDNGQIDGDTVSVYHNNELVVAAARLSQVPVRVRIRVDAAHPHHELVMVAHNLGTIPPNTSLMVVTAGNDKYQVNISASDQKNARVVFQWKE